MPTKHKRKRDDDRSNFNLPPTAKARSLPVIAPTKDFLTSNKKQKLADGTAKKRKKSRANTDDTPKTFARLMAWQNEGKKLGSGLDDGKAGKKKAKRSKNDDTMGTVKKQNVEDEQNPQTGATELPKIKPGESLREYGLRVDQSLPLSSMQKTNINPNASMPADLIEQEKKAKAKSLTKHNKRLARMQADWRRTEAKLREKEEEEAEENAEKLEEEKLLWDGVKTVGKKGKKKVLEDDPWKELEKKRRAEEGRRKRGEALGLTAKDQAQAPPEINVKKLNPFKEKRNPRMPVSSLV